MTITVTETQVYVGIIILLMVIQMYQHKIISKLEKENKQIWEQIGIIVVSLGAELGNLQKDLNKKEDKK
jgi:hypothetical protein